MNKLLPIIIGVVLIVLVGGLVFWQQSSNETPSTTATSTTTTQTGGTDTGAPTSYTMADVSSHNSASSCWTVIDSVVYDLTAWIPQHPGGEQAIIGLCGKDGTAAFRAQHDHAQRQENILATFAIGTLTQ